MNLPEILKILSDIAVDTESNCFIVGGSPRDKVMNKPEQIDDIDLTSGDEKIHYIAKEASIKLKDLNGSYKVLDDGHAQITIGKFKLDFSSNFNIPNIKQILNKAGLKGATDMQCELYSRDFTCNTLLMTLDLKQILDPTGLALKDIKSKTLRTCLPAAITLGYDNKRVVRILYMAAKLNFTVDPEIIDWVKEHPESIANCSPNYLIKKLAKSIEYNKDITVDLLNKMNLWKSIPPMKELQSLMVKNPEKI
jgi:poly(A) polymerase